LIPVLYMILEDFKGLVSRKPKKVEVKTEVV